MGHVDTVRAFTSVGGDNNHVRAGVKDDLKGLGRVSEDDGSSVAEVFGIGDDCVS